MLQSEFKEQFFYLKDKMFRFAKYYLKNDAEAEDIVQDTFLKLWNKKNSLSDVRNKETYAMSMIKNASIDRIRKMKTISLEEVKKEPENILTPLDSLSQKETHGHLMNLISRLNEQQQTLIILRDVEGYEYHEIEEITGLSINTIRVNISRARNTIKEKLLKLNTDELATIRTIS